MSEGELIQATQATWGNVISLMPSRSQWNFAPVDVASEIASSGVKPASTRPEATVSPCSTLSMPSALASSKVTEHRWPVTVAPTWCASSTAAASTARETFGHAKLLPRGHQGKMSRSIRAGDTERRQAMRTLTIALLRLRRRGPAPRPPAGRPNQVITYDAARREPTSATCLRYSCGSVRPATARSRMLRGARPR